MPPPFSSSTSQPLTCWVVTDGKAGMENQCLGLAEALAITPLIKRVKLRSPWRQLSPFLRHGLQWSFDPAGDPIAPPWPDVLIATGRASIPASLHVRQLSRHGKNKGTVTVQIQNPVIHVSRFDLVVVPRHDALIGDNVITTRGSLHRVTPEMLKREAALFAPQVAHLSSPRVAVLLGGSNAVYSLTPREMKILAAQLKALADQGVSLMITPSRRTGEATMALLRQAMQGTNAYIWDWNGGVPNPYYGMLGLCDAIIATCDSVGMITEACSTGKPVMIVHLPGGSDKFRRFHQAMRDDGMTRPFTGPIEFWDYAPLDDMKLVATRVKTLLT